MLLRPSQRLQELSYLSTLNPHWSPGWVAAGLVWVPEGSGGESWMMPPGGSITPLCIVRNAETSLSLLRAGRCTLANNCES